MTYCIEKGYRLALTGSVGCEPELNDNNAYCSNTGTEKAQSHCGQYFRRTGCGALLHC